MVGELERSLEEKSLLIQEVNHRVKNNLQMINDFVNIQAQFTDGDEAMMFAEGIRGRIRAISLVHELILEKSLPTEMQFKDYVLQLIGELESIYYRGDAFDCHCDIAPVQLGLSANMYLGILLNELVSNSMKHARTEGEPLVIWIALHHEKGQLRLQYRDSGEGIPEKELAGKGEGKGIGLMLVNAMVEQLEGKSSYHREGGGVFRVEFPEPEGA